MRAFAIESEQRSVGVVEGSGREAEVRVEIGEGNEIAAHPVMEALDGIESEALSRIAGVESF